MIGAAAVQLVEIFLPLFDNEGSALPRSQFASVEKELTDKFGGVTAYPRAPASGVWIQDGGNEQRDELIIYEVMAESMDVVWWKSYRERLERVFKQEQILIRSHEVRQL